MYVQVALAATNFIAVLAAFILIKRGSSQDMQELRKKRLSKLKPEDLIHEAEITE